MTLIQLEYIVALDKYRHFATAAQNCFVTQPTLSMQVSKLEEELNIKIFDRSKHPVVPTESGKLIIEQARKILGESTRLKKLVGNSREEASGDLKIGIVPTLAPYLVPLFITSFIKNFPQVKVSIEELQTAEIVRKLKNELLDAGILITPLHEQGLTEEILFYEEFVGYISRTHPLFKKKHLHTGDLGGPDMWVLNQGHCFRNQALNLCEGRQNKEEQYCFEFESGSLETLKKIVDYEHGYTLLPELALLDPSINNLYVRKFYSPKPLREISLVTHRAFVKEFLIRKLKAEILKVIPEKMKKPEEGKVIHWK